MLRCLVGEQLRTVALADVRHQAAAVFILIRRVVRALLIDGGKAGKLEPLGT